MTKPAAARSRTTRSVKASPAAEALREPMTATMGRANTARSPCTAISGGGEWMAAGSLGAQLCYAEWMKIFFEGIERNRKCSI